MTIHRMKIREIKKYSETHSLLFTYLAIESHPVKHANACIECQLLL